MSEYIPSRQDPIPATPQRRPGHISALGLLLLVLWAVGLTQAARSSAAPDLRSFFEEIDAGTPAVIGGHVLSHPRALAQIYAERLHAPIWTAGGPLARQIGALLAAVEESAAHGLNPGNYHRALLGRMAEASARPLDLAVELLLSDAFIKQALHRSTGAVSPRALDPDWYLIAPEIDVSEALRRALAPGGSVRAVLGDLWPRNEEYRALVAKRARLTTLGEPQFEQVPAGPLLRLGQTGERVRILKERLLGAGEYGDDFDERLTEAVLAQQRAAGLEADGIVGPATLEVLNATTAAWIERIDANLERWRWLPQTMPETYVRVNIAAFALRVIDHGQEVLRMDAIVGRPYRRTPIFSESIKYLVFNPYWNVPFKLAVEDKLPILKKDPAQLEALGYEVRPAGEEQFLPVGAIDWSGITRGSFRFLLRQRPGPGNALGRVKFMLPNPHDVYLHDTPDRELFARQERGFSSGCIRLSQAGELARWILTHDGRAEDAARVPQLASGEETTTIYLHQPLPVYLVYFTAFTDDSGEVVFRRDLYQRDSAILAALRADSPS